MWRVPALAVACAGWLCVAVPQSPVPATVIWDLDQTHADATFEIEIDGATVQPCGNVTTTATDRRCTTTLPLGTHTYRLRGINSGGLGEWSQPFADAVIETAPGQFTVTSKHVTEPEPEPEPMADFVVDTFTDTTGTELSAHTGETGASWTRVVGDGTHYIEINANRARPVGSSSARYYASGVPASADYSVVVNVDFISIGGLVAFAFGGRVSTSQDDGVWVEIDGFTDVLKCYQTVNGSTTPIGSSVSWTTSDHELTLELSGSNVTVLVNGSSAITGTTTVSAAGRVGLRKFASEVTSNFFMFYDITATDAAADVVLTPDQGAMVVTGRGVSMNHTINLPDEP